MFSNLNVSEQVYMFLKKLKNQNQYKQSINNKLTDLVISVKTIFFYNTFKTHKQF